MTFRRRSAITTALLGFALFPAVSVSAQTDGGTEPPPADATEPPVDENGDEIVHSWALAPAGNDEGGAGNRSNLTYTADPGTVLEDAVTLYNLSNVPLFFDIYATDAFNNADGEFDLLAADDEPAGVGTWVDMGADQVPVAARTQVTIPITITIPETAAPGDHAGAILAASASESTGPEGQQITLDRRTGTQLFVRVNGPLVPELAIADVSHDYTASLNPFGGSSAVTYTIENRGNVSLSGAATVSVGGPLGLAEQSTTPRDLPLILPGQSVTITEEFDGVPATVLSTAEVELVPDGDGADVLDAESVRTSTLAPPIALIAALLLLLFGLLTWRAIRRHQQRAAEGDGVVLVGELVEFDRDRERQPT